MKRFFLPILVLSASLAGPLAAQSLVIYSGNGQVVNSGSSKTTDLLVVQALDSKGKPLPGVAIDWSITAGQGNIPHQTNVTDVNGLATTDFTSTALQNSVSFLDTTVTASSKYGSANFHVITVLFIFGSQTPSFTLLAPDPGATLTAQPGATLPAAVKVRVLAGVGGQSNAPIPNVGVYLVDGISLMPSTVAHCNGPDGVVFTDAMGSATCDIVVTGQPGIYSLRANGGDYQNTTSFVLQINPGPTCGYSISPTSNPVLARGGNGTVKVTATSGCGWAATSNVDWITITSGLSGTGNGTVSYSVGADAGAARTGTMTIAGQTFTVNQGSGSAGSLTITTPANLPGGTVNQSYSATLSASGGIAPYSWSITQGSLPAGLSLNSATGLISGAPTAAGTNSFTATVQDSAGTRVPLVFSLTVSTSSSTFEITNKSFPNGVVGQPYTPQILTSSGGAVTLFGSNPIFQVSGGALPDGLSLVRSNANQSYSIAGTPTTAGVFNFTLSATDAKNDTAAANFTITITGTPTSEVMAVSPGTLSFTVQLGSATAPAPQSLSITGNGGVLNYTSVATSDTNWLALQNSAGSTRGTITVSVSNYANLQPGSYNGTVTISSAASNSPVAVPVTLTVVAAPSLTVSPPQINLSQGQSIASNIAKQDIQVSAGASTGPGHDVPAVSFTATVTTNKGGNWLTVTPTSGTTPAILTASIDSGGLAVGTYAGTITITPTSGAVQLVTVTLTVINPQMLSATPAPVAFAYTQGAPPPQSQTVTVSSSTGPALNLSATVETSDKGSWLSVNPSTGTTPLGLTVSVNPAGLAPNTYTGTITVTASDDSVAPLPIPVTLTITPPEPTINSAVNAASFAPGPVAPGELITIFGSGLGPDQPLGPDTSSGFISRTLGGTQVFFDNNAAPILYTSATQVSVIVPYELASSSSTKLTVWYQGNASAVDNLRVIEAVPGIFTVNSSGQGAIVNQDGTVNSSSNGAPVGSTVSIYATGQGNLPPSIDDAISTGASAQPPPLPVMVNIGGLPATVTYAGAAPFEPAGIMQVNATIPAGVGVGSSVPIVVTVGTAPSQAGVTIAIHP